MNYTTGEGPSNLSSSSSDDEYEEAHRARREVVARMISENNQIILNHLNEDRGRFRGSVPGHRMIFRERELANRRIFNDYFSETPLYNDAMFRRRYRMRRSLFMRILNAVCDHDDYFVQKSDATGRLGLSSLQKVTASFRMLAYGVPADSTDEYVKIGESTVVESLKRFCRAIVEVFGCQYLRSPNVDDVSRLLQIGEHRGFPGMLGSLDCMHWKWKNCPTAWAGQYTGRSGTPTMILEAVADYDLWIWAIWHAYFGLPGSNNDINVLESSHLFDDLAKGIAPTARYVIQGKEYTMGYYLADGIYPKWSTLVQTIHDPRGPKKKYFATRQEACRKDVERAFGVLKSRFAIVAGPSRFWRKKTLYDIMSACIIMHNMIIEDERDLNASFEERDVISTPTIEEPANDSIRFEQFLGRYREIKNKDAHIALRNALVDHMWEKYTNSEY